MADPQPGCHIPLKGLHLGPLDEAIKAQGEARAAFRAGQAQREQAASNRKKAAEEALAKIDEITERQLSDDDLRSITAYLRELGSAG